MKNPKPSWQTKDAQPGSLHPAGSAASLKSEIASLKEKLRQRMKAERTARVATTRWGGTIYKLRAARGMSCTEVARACGKTNAYVTTMETGKKHNPTLDTIERLASAFGMKASELVKTYEQQPPPNDPGEPSGVKPPESKD